MILGYTDPNDGDKITTGSDIIRGDAGNDYIDGSAGNDSVSGGDGNDTLVASSGNDTLVGGASNDLFVINANQGSGTQDQVGTANDLFQNITAHEQIDLTAFAGVHHFSDLTITTIGNNVFSIALPGGQNLTVYAEGQLTSNDFHINAPTINIVYGTAGNDYIDTSYVDIYGHRVGAGDDSVIGLTGHDTFVSSGGNDTFDGSQGSASFLITATGHDSLIGGGNGGVSYFYDTTGVNVNLTTGLGHGGFAEGDTLSGIESVVGGSGNDTLIGNNNGNLLNGYLGNDNIQGGTGNDYVDGGMGADTINGGGGVDTLSYQHDTAGVNVNLATGLGHGGEAEGDVFSGMEVVWGGGANDTITGGNGNETLIGNGGDDSIVAGKGNDSLQGGDGNDVLVGSGSASTVSSVNLITNGSFESFTGHSADIGARATAMAGWQLLSGGGWGGWELLHNGYSGITVPDGKYALDMESSGGNDNMDIQQNVQGIVNGQSYSVSFVASAEAGWHGNSVNVYWGNQLIGNVATETVANQTYSFTVVGGSGNGSNALRLQGEGPQDGVGLAIDNVKLVAFNNSTTDGNDMLYGGNGNDTLTGGAGNNQFIFHAADSFNTTITDFTFGFDKIAIQGVNYNQLSISNAGNGTNISFNYGGHNDIIHLNNVSASALHSNDFIFS